MDIWAIGCGLCSSAFRSSILTFKSSIITYVLLCGYSPFRSDDLSVLVKETTEARIEFHERYWKNVSDSGESVDIWVEEDWNSYDFPLHSQDVREKTSQP